MAPFTKLLCRAHAAWADDRTRYEEVPDGWHPIVSRLFADIAAVMVAHPGERVAIRQIKEKFGTLRVYAGLVSPRGDTPRWYGSVRALIAAAEQASLETCDRCGAAGRLRSGTGFCATRCDEHAEPGATLESATPSAAEDTTSKTEPNDHSSAPRDVDSWPSLGKGVIDRLSRWESDEPAPSDDPSRMPLYATADVAAAAGLERDPDESGGDPTERSAADRSDTEHQARLSRILDGGERGRWRDLAMVEDGILNGLDELSHRAPHLNIVTNLVRRHLLASRTLGLPIALPPVLLLSPPGVGKSWYLARLAAVLGLPFRSYPMNIATLGDGISGGHPTWRNAAPGLVARTLLRERVANPLLLVDEFDKAQDHLNRDPYTPFYSLLDPSNAAAFIDEYLQFPIDASHVLWVLAGNDASLIPAPIMDRLTVLTVPDMSADQRAAVCRSIYAEANAARRSFFDPDLAGDVLERLCEANPRSIRVIIEDAMVTAAADGRARLSPDDVRGRPAAASRRIGFR